MGNKGWKNRMRQVVEDLENSYEDAGGLATRHMDLTDEKKAKKIWGCVAQGAPGFKKPIKKSAWLASQEYKDRKKRRCIVALEGIYQFVKGPSPTGNADRFKKFITHLKQKNKQVQHSNARALKNEKDRIWRLIKGILEERERQSRQREIQRQIRLRNQYGLPAKERTAMLSVTNFLNFMKTWSIQPTPEIVGDGNLTELAVNGDDQKRKMMLIKSPVKRGALDLTDAVGQVNSPLGEFYYLPWASRHITSLEIPDSPRTDGSPRVFFTSALSGCSVFVRGNPHSPTVYHAGINGNVGDDPQPRGRIATHWKPFNAVTFWRHLLRYVVNTNDNLRLSLGELIKSTGEANKKGYVDDETKPQGTFDASKRQTTDRSRELLKFLQDAYKASNTQPNVKSVKPWGCVFGVRDSRTREWSFYLQENASVIYEQHGKPGAFYVSTPIGIRKFFPKANPRKSMHPYLYRAYKNRLRFRDLYTKDGIRIV